MRPIPVDVIPSHAYLSQADQAKLFGQGYAMTIDNELTQGGQHEYKETVAVKGRLKRTIDVHVLGPNWERSFVELTEIEANYLGLNPPEALSGDLTKAAPCTLIGPIGEVFLEAGVIVVSPHLRVNPLQARELGVMNGDLVSVEILGANAKILENVRVRVHPTFNLRLEINADYARKLWIARTSHARLIL
ncbi:phosphate propanoyltransferase [Candidatus Parcubacteria bacterium]|nr:MAG: phosphate propanoyltransferase [Candidatus Parcubacteria bacterium]